MSVKINIYGGGLSGLSTAFELSKYDFDITIYEQEEINGGFAKSKYINNLPTEHSWRAYGPFYYNTFDLFKKIPINNICNNNITNIYNIDDIKNHNTKDDMWCYYKNNVYNITELINIHPYGLLILQAGSNDLEQVFKTISCNNYTEILEILDTYIIGYIEINNKNAFNNLIKLDFYYLFNNININNRLTHYYDYMYIIYLLLKVNLSNNRQDIYFTEQLMPLLKNKIHINTFNYCCDYLVGLFGFNKHTISLGHFAKMLEFYYNSRFNKWSIMNKPTNDAFIDSLVDILKRNNVKINNKYILNKINVKDNIIINCIVNNQIVNADIHIFCLNPYNFQTILNNSNIINNYDNLNIINNQISFRIGFNTKLKLQSNIDINANGYILIDSPYNITFYSQTDAWSLNYITNNNIKTLLSGTILQPYNKGILYNKSALLLNIEELKEEIKHQFINSIEFINIIKNNNNLYELSLLDFIYIEIYDDWYFDNNTKLLTPKNKQWCNTFTNESYRPSQISYLLNGYIGGAHTQTTTNIWSMESAIESSKIISNIILKKYNKPLTYIYNHNSNNILTNLIKTSDDILYIFNLPHILDIFIIIISIIISINMIIKN